MSSKFAWEQSPYAGGLYQPPLKLGLDDHVWHLHDEHIEIPTGTVMEVEYPVAPGEIPPIDHCLCWIQGYTTCCYCEDFPHARVTAEIMRMAPPPIPPCIIKNAECVQDRVPPDEDW